MRRPALAVLAATGLVLGAAALPAQAQSSTTPSPSQADSYGTVRNILPPGQRGSVDALQLSKVLLSDPTKRVAIDGKNAPTNFADQLEMYDALGTKAPSAITESTVDSLYKKAGFVPEKVVSTEHPKAGVTIQRDQYGVPYITGDTYADVEWGAGYAGTQDRMFLMDVLRHAGAGHAAEFIGGTADNIEMDREQTRLAYYTPKEAEDQLQVIADENGAEGQKLLTGADAYLAGINAAQNTMCPLGLPTGPHCPAEYLALQKKPTPWTRADLTYVASLVGGIFGKGGGQEYANAMFYDKLVKKYGQKTAGTLFSELREKNDSSAPTTSTLSFPYDDKPFDPTQKGVALPDLGATNGSGTGDDAGSTSPLETLLDSLTLLTTGKTPTLDGPDGKIPLAVGQRSAMSNALLVGAKATKTGHPLAVFGPQTGYYAPQLLSEQVLMGPGIMARGVSFAGTNLVVELGHGLDYAWSATSAGSDNVDTVAEKLCNADGTQPTVQSTSYMDGSTCTPMRYDENKETVVPNITAPTAPKTLKMQVWRTKHGIVQLRTTVKGVPVALTQERTTYGREAASILGFSRFDNPDYVHDAKSFAKAAAGIDYTFNWFYADDKDIAYYSSGRLPERAKGTDTDLPHWGTSTYDWKGFLPAAKHVQQVDPPTSYLASWNNKPAKNFAAADDTWDDGPIHRSMELSTRLASAVKKGGVTRAQLDGIMEDAATEDLRGDELLPTILKVLGNDPKTAAARKVLAAWAASGAHRVDRDRTGHYAQQAAIALFDEWWKGSDAAGTDSLPYAFASARLGSLASQLPVPEDNHPREGQGSSWLGVPWYSYVDKDLRTLLGQKVGSPFALPLCGKGKLAACRADLSASLQDAVTRAEKAQGVTSVAALTYDKTQDDIVHSAGGVVGVRDIDWQNRPTFQQVVSYTSHRPR